MNFSQYYFTDNELKEQFLNEVSLLLKEDEDTNNIDPIFVSRLMNYLEKVFPSYGSFDGAVGKELIKYVKGDQKHIKKIKKKIHDIISKARVKFLDTVQNKIERVSVTPRNKSPKPIPTPGANIEPDITDIEM